MAKDFPSIAQLAGLRAIFRVVDHDEVAARDLQGVVERLGLGARSAGWHDEKPEVGGQGKLSGSGLCLRIVGLEDEKNLELGQGIVEGLQRLHQCGQDVALAVQRDEHAVEGQHPVGHAASARAGHVNLLPRPPEGLAQGYKPQSRHAQEREGDQCSQGGDSDVGQHREAANDQAGHNRTCHHLPGREGGGRRACGLRPQEAAHGEVDALGQQVLLQRGLDAALWGQHDGHALRMEVRDVAEHDIG